MSTAVEGKLATLEGWLTQEAPDGLQAEFVDGELMMNPLAGYPHQAVLNNLLCLLIPYQIAHPQRIRRILSPARLALPELGEGREPDLAVYDSEPADPWGTLAWAQARPFLVAEIVSPRQESRDYIDKYASYYRAQIQEYWIVDPQERRLTALRWAPERWRETVFLQQGAYTTDLLPDFSLEVAKLWL